MTYIPLLLLTVSFAVGASGFKVFGRISSRSSRFYGSNDGWNASPRSDREIQVGNIWQLASRVSAALIVALPSSAIAVQGSIKSSTLAETQKAVEQVKICLDGLRTMEEAAAKQEWQVIGDLLSTKPYMKFEEAATTLVRSDSVSAEDKQSLGTIKRYGLVADAIIMLGGLGAELKAAGVKVAGVEFQGIPDGGDEDDDEDEGEVKKPRVNGGEVRRFIKLSKDALGDIYRIVAPILKK